MLAKRIGQLRWQIPLLAFLLVLFHQLLEHTVLFYLSRWQHFWTQFIFYGILGPFLTWLALSYIEKRVMEKEEALSALQSTHIELEETSLRLEFLIEVNHRLIETEDEEELTKVIMELPQEVIPSIGSSLIRFDEKLEPRSALHSGELDPEIFAAWATHLSSPNGDDYCPHCTLHWAVDADSCPTLNHTGESLPAAEVYCMELTRGKRKFANLVLYLQDETRPSEREEKLLSAMAGEMSLALESQDLRSRELGMLYHLQQARQSDGLHEALAKVLTHLAESLDVDGGAIFLNEGDDIPPREIAQTGATSDELQKMLQGMSKGLSQTNPHIRIADLDHNSSTRSLLIVSLPGETSSLGGIALWSASSNFFTKRHIQLVSTVAGQAALSLENHQLYLQASFQAQLAERARLAREIHDGLAQTLGYLKLRTGQIIKWLDLGEVEKSNQALTDIQGTLAGAYIDAREAIDGLRIIHESDDWLEQVLAEFQQLTAINVAAPPMLGMQLLPEVQSQLQRIVQEALSNIRKYSSASKVEITWQEEDDHLTLGIRDDGLGFEPDEVPPISRHGLRIMKERAELLDGEFEIRSRPNEGTTITVRLPLQRILAGVLP